MINKKTARLCYAAAFLLILAIEVLIALFIRDRFIRPYGGDILVTVLICCFFQIFFLTDSPLLPVCVFIFAAAVEIGQYFDFVFLLGLEDSLILSIALGSTFSWGDLICYASGCLLFFLCDTILRRCAKRRTTSGQ